MPTTQQSDSVQEGKSVFCKILEVGSIAKYDEFDSVLMLSECMPGLVGDISMKIPSDWARHFTPGKIISLSLDAS